ncbi:MAG: LysR family transcriptional regulator [Gammaproteobacteria bacterium]|nr:LysR family transcriptional regulator [Gammaproteobacteria bacterium]
MPRKNRPPIHLLEVFEAAARLGSFKQAGEELHISASAISHQIKSLEEILGFPLFKRITRGVKLTKEGLDYAYSLTDAFRLIDQASEQILPKANTTKIRASIMPSLVNNLIYPNIEEFKQQHPEIELEIESCEELSDLNDPDIDFAIRFGYGNWPDLDAKLLRKGHGVILASPDFIAKNQPTDPELLSDLPLICLNSAENAWHALAKALKIKHFQIKNPLNYHSYGAAIQAAQQDLGLVPAVYELEKSLINKNKLLPVYDIKAELSSGIYLVKAKHKKLSNEAELLVDWLQQQIDSL